MLTPESNASEGNRSDSRVWDTSGQSNIVSSSSMTETYKSYLSCTEAQKQYSCGVLITIILGTLWVGFTQFSKNTYTESFTAPLIVVYFHTSWLVVFYPVYITVVFIVARGSIQLKQLYSENFKIYKEETKLVRFSVRTCAFCFIWAISNYSYIRALQLLDSVDVIALYSTNQSFVYMLSWIILFEKFIAIRILAIIFSITGIVLFAYADGFGTSNMWGVVLAVVSASAAAVYKIFCKKFIGEVNFGKISLFLSLVGLTNLLVLWPFVLLFYFTKTEFVDWFDLPWTPLCASAVFTTAHQLVFNYSGVFTITFFIETALLFGIPLGAIADIVWRNSHFSGMKISALVLIEVGLLLTILPEGWHHHVMRGFRFVKELVSKPPPEEDIPPQTSRFEWRNSIN
ncbi:solute carrier family 35 member F4 isoform X2 [Octopus sinensis]|nr:solute carrier family 35 member F4 isoform X2 [Octopus sinensis]